MTLATTVALVAAMAIGQGAAKKGGAARTLRPGDEAVFRLAGDEAEPGTADLRASGAIDGESAVLLVLSGEESAFAEDAATLKAAFEARKAGDRAGMSALIEEGRAVRVRSGTRLLTLKRGEGTTLSALKSMGGLPVAGRGVAKVRILDGPEAGRVAWCCIRNLAPPPK